MGQVEFRAERSGDSGAAQNPMQVRYAEGATPQQAAAAVAAIQRQAGDVDAAMYVVRLQAVHALAAQGHSARDIAAMGLGMSKSTIGRIMRDSADAVAVRPGIDVIIAHAWGGRECG